MVSRRGEEGLHPEGCGREARMWLLWMVRLCLVDCPCSRLGAETGRHRKDRTRSRGQGGGSAELRGL